MTGNVTAPRALRGTLAACLLPWTAAFELDEDAFDRHVTTTIDDGFTSVYVMGTAGEGYAIDAIRFAQVVRRFAAVTAPRGVDAQVGVISLSMDDVIRRIGTARDLGISVFQISLPAWGALDDEELVGFFRTVCGTFPDCRFLHYNLSRTKRLLTGADYRRLTEAVPNLVATKNSNDSYGCTAELLTEAQELQHVLLETNFAMGCTVGECSLLCSLAPLFPKTTHALFDAGVRRDLPTLFRLTHLLRQAAADLFAPLTRTMIDGAYDKTLVWLRDESFPTRLLPPYLGPTAHELENVRRIFDARYRDLG